MKNLPPVAAKPKRTIDQQEVERLAREGGYPLTTPPAPSPARGQRPDNLVALSVNMPKSLRRQIRERATRDDTTVAAIVMQALADAGFDVNPMYLKDRRREK